MRLNWFYAVVSTLAKSCGLLLVLTALGTPAYGFDLPSAPEINPASAATALPLLIGGLLMITDRCRRK
jgi:hypothetical protein